MMDSEVDRINQVIDEARSLLEHFFVHMITDFNEKLKYYLVFIPVVSEVFVYISQKYDIEMERVVQTLKDRLMEIEQIRELVQRRSAQNADLFSAFEFSHQELKIISSQDLELLLLDLQHTMLTAKDDVAKSFVSAIEQLCKDKKPLPILGFELLMHLTDLPALRNNRELERKIIDEYGYLMYHERRTYFALLNEVATRGENEVF